MSETDVTAHTWGDAPEFYGPRHDYREAVVLRRLLPALSGRRVLNAGAGAGSLTMRMIDAGLEVTSVDASAAFCDRIRGMLSARGREEAHPVLRSELGTGALDLPAGEFDGVVCAEVLEHLDNDREALTEFAQVLRPGGFLLVTVPANPYRYDWTDQWAGHRRRYTVEGLHERLAAAGFVDIDVLGWGFPMTGFFHRHVYRRVMRRRMEAGGGGGVGGAPPGLASKAVRAVLEIDSFFIGRRPGYHGLIATARRGDDPGT